MEEIGLCLSINTCSSCLSWKQLLWLTCLCGDQAIAHLALLPFCPKVARMSQEGTLCLVSLINAMESSLKCKLTLQQTQLRFAVKLDEPGQQDCPCL